jgi:hypothetical protein
MHVILHSPAYLHISRIWDVHPSEGDLFYFYALLQHRSASSYMDAWTVNGIEYQTFQEAATKFGLFANEKEFKYALMEAIQSLKTPRQLFLLFVHLLVNDCVHIYNENRVHHMVHVSSNATGSTAQALDHNMHHHSQQICFNCNIPLPN